MNCPFIVKSDSCNTQNCESLNEERKNIGAIYMIDDQDEEYFITMLYKKPK